MQAEFRQWRPLPIHTGKKRSASGTPTTAGAAVQVTRSSCQLPQGECGIGMHAEQVRQHDSQRLGTHGVAHTHEARRAAGQQTPRRL